MTCYGAQYRPTTRFGRFIEWLGGMLKPAEKPMGWSIKFSYMASTAGPIRRITLMYYSRAKDKHLAVEEVRERFKHRPKLRIHAVRPGVVVEG